MDSLAEADDRSAVVAHAPGRDPLKQLRELFRVSGLFIGIVVVGVVFAVMNDGFATPTNLFELVRSMASLAIIALGLTFVIISGELDLSVGAIYGFAAMLTAVLWTEGAPLYLALAAGLGAGCAIGLLNGALSIFARIPSFIVTLGTLNFFQGASLLISDAQGVSPAYSDPPVDEGQLSFFRAIGSSELPLGIPIQVLWLAVTAVICAVLLHRSLFGFRMYAIGGNNDAARAARLPVKRLKISAFVLCGFLAALAGLLDFSFLGSTEPGAGIALTFPVFAAVVIGGASLSGGRGTILGTLCGALLLALLANGLGLIGVGSFAQLMFVGVVTIAAVGLDRLSQPRGRTRA